MHTSIQHFWRGLATACLLAAATLSQAFSLIAPGGPADLINEPDRYYSFDPGVITWKMDDGFRSTYSDPDLLNQVRLAFDEWQAGSSHADRRSATRYRWNRFNGEQDAIDLKSVVTHEIGHAIGFQHADAAWFNEQGDTGSPWNRNYRYIGGVLTAVAPLGGEIMNEGNQDGFMPAQKSPTGIRAGEYWRTLSKDEIAGLDYAYGDAIDFQEVGPDDDAMITVSIFQGSGGGNLGVAGPDTWEFRNGVNSDDGRLILTSSIGISNNANKPIGILPRTSSWYYENATGEALVGINVRSEGTSTRNPLAVYSSGANRFNDYEAANTLLAHEFENRGHRFSDPSGGSIPVSGGVQFGLKLDVWDWTVDRATAITTGGDPIALPVVALHGFNHGGYANPDNDDHDHFAGGGADDLADGMTTASGVYTKLVEGIRIAAGAEPATLVELAFASVEGLGLDGDDLNPQTLALLQTTGALKPISLPAVQLGAYEDLFVVLDGLVDDLPADLQAAGNFLMAGNPLFEEAMAAGEVLVYARTTGQAGSVGSFSLLNSAAIVGQMVPEPSCLLLAVMAAFSATGRRQTR
jgi:hypothetical protein